MTTSDTARPPRSAAAPRLPAESEQAITEAAVALNTVGCWLLSPALKRRIATEAGLTLPPGDYTLLVQIERWQPVRLSSIADRLELDRSSLTAQTRRLETAGLIVRLADPEDHRAQLVEVTEGGRTVLGRLWAARTRALADLVAQWDAEDLARLTDSMSALAHSVRENVHGEAA